MAIKGTTHDDDLSGTTGDDIFNLMLGGEDSADGGDGKDLFRLGDALSAGDVLTGGDGNDVLTLEGDYSGGFTFGSGALSSVETTRMSGPFDYSITMNDANVAAGARLTVNASSLTAGHKLTFNGAAELDGHFRFVGSEGDDAITGGARADRFTLDRGGNDSAYGGGGQDTFRMADAFNPGDTIDGGTGDDTLVLDGDYSAGITLGASTIANIEEIELVSGHSYNLTLNDGNVAADEEFTISAAGLDDTLIFNGGAETSGHLLVFGGSGNDDILTGAGDDYILGGVGADTLYGSDGGDTFVYAFADNSPADTFTNVDYLGDFSATEDHLLLLFAPAINYVGTASGDANDFSDLETLLDGKFDEDSNNAVLYSNNNGGLSVGVYLFVDLDGSGTWTGADDLAIDMTSMTDAGSFGQHNFGL